MGTITSPTSFGPIRPETRPIFPIILSSAMPLPATGPANPHDPTNRSHPERGSPLTRTDRPFTGLCRGAPNFVRSLCDVPADSCCDVPVHPVQRTHTTLEPWPN